MEVLTAQSYKKNEYYTIGISSIARLCVYLQVNQTKS